MDISAGIAGCTAVAGSHSARVHGSKTCSAAGNSATACSAEMSPGNCPLTRFNRSLATRWILELRVSIGEVRGETAARRTMSSTHFRRAVGCEVLQWFSFRTGEGGELRRWERSSGGRAGTAGERESDTADYAAIATRTSDATLAMMRNWEYGVFQFSQLSFTLAVSGS